MSSSAALAPGGARRVMRAPLQRPPPARPSVRPPVQAPAPSALPAVARNLPVSQPSDPAEREAERVARRVVGMPAPGAASPAASRFNGLVPSSGSGGGEPLPRALRQQMEPRFRADFSAVRIHTGGDAAQASRQLNAAAFTVGQHIYFGRGRFQPDSSEGRELIAHELAHTIQQGAAPQAGGVQRSLDTTVRERAAPTVQRLGVSDAIDWFADKATLIPGFRLFTLVIGFNPVNGRGVERSAANLLRALVEVLPGGALITQALDNHGVFDRVAAWAGAQLQALAGIGADVRHAIDDFLAGLGWTDIFDLGGLWQRARRLVAEPVDRLLAFGRGLVEGIVGFVREAILTPLAALAQGTRGYPLLCAVLGSDPVTGEAVPRTPANLIGGFMSLVGQEEVWQNIQRANAVQRCWAWFQGALAGLMGFVRRVPGEFIAALRSLEIADLILVPRAFARVAGAFAGFVGEFLSWAGNAVWTLLELIFEVVAPRALPYLRRAAGSFRDILRRPIPFVANLVRAGRLGFEQFAGNVGNHLKRALIEWLTGSLPGVYIPARLEIREILKFVLSVLGLTWDNIRAKLVKAVGETAVKVLETGFKLVATLVTEGPAAAWQEIKDQLADLKDQVLGAITTFVVETVVKKAVMKVVSLLIPGGAFLQAILSIYDTILVFIDKLARIIQVATAFLDSMMDIAAGRLANAANKVENVLAGLLSLAISFLAGFLGLGRIADKVMDVIRKIRAPIDKALDWLVGFIVKGAKSLLGGARQAVKDWWKKPKPFRTRGGADHELTFVGDEASAVPMVASKLKRSVPEHAADMKKKAASPEATETQKKNAALIDATIALARTGPNDPLLVSNMQLLFETYDEGGANKKPVITRVLGNLGGSGVCLSMSIDWLSRSHPDGTPPGTSSQRALMDQLVTEPRKGRPSEDKYIRGHLLNHNLGGLGDETNMFPITGNANKNHLVTTEAKIKAWVDTPNTWVKYDVKVAGLSADLKGAAHKDTNFVNCSFVCAAVHKDDKGNVKATLSTTIPSTYQFKHTADNTDFQAKGP